MITIMRLWRTLNIARWNARSTLTTQNLVAGIVDAGSQRSTGTTGPGYKKKTRRAGTPSGRREAREGERSGDRESKRREDLPPGANLT